MVIVVVEVGAAPTAAGAQMLEACIEKAAETLGPNELEFEMLEEEKEEEEVVITGGYDAVNAALGPEGRSARSAKAAETRYGSAGFGAGIAAETLGPEGRPARAAASWSGGKRQAVVEAETPREDGSCAICGDREAIPRGMCERCYRQK
ncbi:hypothetical protein HYH02_003829 [Chlamydomonas schloesseri]|uniref:Uncharacterized protein n=1 Tax=Chlamydomonas schloesseri TaxID=2026947 RepID=A0A836B8W5_9CHLO|nr:hypothetical protein HYH02_003829 [Chlamydomonas schloesseri]|eukprot:KAG2451222.1 hypothetical protein HYH02_003829 [Chlamydomonas schloesseri]